MREAPAVPHGGHRLPGPDWTCDHEHDDVNAGACFVQQSANGNQQSTIRGRRHEESRMAIMRLQFDESEMHEIANSKRVARRVVALCPAPSAGAGASIQNSTSAPVPELRDTALGPTDERLGIVRLDWHRFALETACSYLHASRFIVAQHLVSPYM